MAGTPNQQGLGGDVGSLKPPHASDIIEAHFFTGNGVPPNSLGADGDIYHRRDTPGVALQRLYVRSGGSWTGIA